MQQSIVKFYSFVVQTLLNMFRALLCPSSGARQTAVAALSYRHYSTCFGHYYAHHQEPVKLPLQLCVQTLLNIFRALLCPSSGSRQTVVAALSYRHCSTCFGHHYAHHQEPVKLPLQPLVSVWMCENTSTSTFIRKPEAATAVWRAPDDGHSNARNMLSSVCTTKQ